MDLIDDFIEELADTKTDLLVLCLVHSYGRTMLRTRIQKEALIFNRIYSETEHTPYYGDSDDIEESYTSLSDIGLLRIKNRGYVLSDFGTEIANTLNRREDEILRKTKLLNDAIHNIDDRSLVAITYALFPYLAEKSIIAESMNNQIDKISLEGKPLRDWIPEDFTRYVRNGTPITMV